MKRPSLTSYWCDHENKRHEVKVIWKDRTEEIFTCIDCGKKITEVIYNDSSSVKHNNKRNKGEEGNDTKSSSPKRI